MDKSGSMAERWDQRTKWQVTNEAFSKAIEGVLDNLTIGAILFPEPDGCSVAPLTSGKQFDFEPGKNFVARWEATAGSRSPQGSTPLGRAFQEADFHIEKACNDGLLDGHFRVIILTDGQPTCTEDPDLFTRLPREWRLARHPDAGLRLAWLAERCRSARRHRRLGRIEPLQGARYAGRARHGLLCCGEVSLPQP